MVVIRQFAKHRPEPSRLNKENYGIYLSIPVAVETSGVIGPESWRFLDRLDGLLYVGGQGITEKGCGSTDVFLWLL